MRTVILQTGFLGDVVLSSPLAAALAADDPDGSITMVVTPRMVELAGMIPGVDAVLAVDKRGADRGPFGLLAAAARLRDAAFDRLLAPHRSTRTALLARLSKAPRRIGFGGNSGRLCYTTAVPIRTEEPCRLEQDFDLLRAAGVSPAGARPVLVPGQRTAGEDLPRSLASAATPRVGICIGSNWPTKVWPVQHVAELCHRLAGRGISAILFGGPGDRDAEQRIRAEFAARAAAPGGRRQRPLYSCVGNSIAEAVGLLAHCDLVIGPDSGLVHAAKAVAGATMVLYGPTDPRLHHDLDATTKVHLELPCQPCHRHGPRRCPEGHCGCMQQISPESVFRLALAELEAASVR